MVSTAHSYVFQTKRYKGTQLYILSVYLFSGALPKREVLDIVRQYNSAFNLDLKDYRINELMTEPNNLDRSGYVILQPFLFKLSA